MNEWRMLFQIIPKGSCSIKYLEEKKLNLKSQKYNYLSTSDPGAHAKESSLRDTVKSIQGKESTDVSYNFTNFLFGTNNFRSVVVLFLLMMMILLFCQL